MEGVVKQIIVDPERCIGCRRCEVICSLAKGNGTQSCPSRIHVASIEERGSFHPLVCQQCLGTFVSGSLPDTGAHKEGSDGIVKLDEERCVGCKMCVLACPYKGITYSEEMGKSIKCDHCGGHPECVIQCTTGALSFQDFTPTFEDLREKARPHIPGDFRMSGMPL